MHRISICACARWEEQHIVEWIEYHLSIGVDHFYIYSNDDHYSTLAEVLLPYITRPAPVVTYIHCPELGIQMKMYEHYRRNFSQQSEWTCLLDIDEFISLPGYNMSILNLISASKNDCDSIQLNWLVFGANGYETRPTGSVLTKYTKCSDKLDLHTKFLVKRDALLNNTFNDNPHCLPLHVPTCDVLGNYINSILWINMGLKSQYTEYFEEYHTKLLKVGFIAHFAYKSHEDLRRRVERCSIGEWQGQAAYSGVVEDQKEEFFKVFETAECLILKKYWEDYIIKKLLPQDLNLDKQAAEIYLQSGQWNQGF
jgi:hypothetical protein